LDCIHAAENDPRLLDASQWGSIEILSDTARGGRHKIMQVARPVNARIRAHLRLLIWLSVISTAMTVSAEEAGVRGFWQEPSGAVIQIASCAHALCLKIVALSPGDHPHSDVYNPDEKLRGRALCGLRIGQDFTETDSHHAEGGHIYDPKSGHTYSGAMMAQGNTLTLRGYLGIKLLGRSETWTRVGQGRATCTPV
jgi:uncharacterized protein (DUF2147 family)